jgi:hypothetical protein
MEANLHCDQTSIAGDAQARMREAIVRTSEVNVIFTSLEATMAALHVAVRLGRGCNASIRLIAPHLMSYPRSAGGMPIARTPVESDAFHARLAAEIDTRVDVLVCISRRFADVARTMLRRHSLVVIGGRHSWWPTRHERLRRTLEAQGHVVVFVNEVDHAAA